MLTLNRLESSNPKVKAFHILQDGNVVGLIIEEDRNDDGTSDWHVSRLGNYGIIERFYNLTEEGMTAKALQLSEGIFQESREYCTIQITTGFGRQLFSAVIDDERVISAVHREILRGEAARQKIKDQYFIDFVTKYLFESGDWPVRIGAVIENSSQYLFKREFEAPTLYK